MKGIKLLLLSVVVTAMLASCGTNTANNTKSATTPKAATNSGNVSKTNDGTVEDDSKGNNMAKDTENAAKDAGDAVGDIAKGTGDAAGDIIDGAGDAVKDAGDAVGNAVDMDKNN